jgi:hypothetical protein
MTTTYASIYLQANGEDYLFTVDATDGNEAEMVNLVSGQSIGDTFSTGQTITAHGPLLLNSSDAAGASTSILGAVLVDPNNNVVFEIPYVDPEKTPIPMPKPCAYPVGLNFQLLVLTANS